MIIYCSCNICKSKIHLNTNAKTRQQLANTSGILFSIVCPHCSAQPQIHVNEVKAQSSYKKAPGAGAIIGGIIGILAGPIGVGIGATIGGLSGGGVRLTDKNEVDLFNNHYV